MNLKIGSLIISDVHYDPVYRKDEFLDLIRKVEVKPPSQIILLGDIFDLLFGEIEYTIDRNREMIEKIDKLGKITEVIYFEGNHDFNLKKLFTYVKVVPISQQPMKFNFNRETILISHGDFSVKGVFFLYRRFIEKSFILFLLNYIDRLFDNSIIKSIERKQRQKDKCYKIDGFKDIIKDKLKSIDCELFIEGHYHQGLVFTMDNKRYINLPSFACNQSCFIVKSKQNSIFFENISLKDL